MKDAEELETHWKSWWYQHESEQRATIDIPRQDDDVLVTNESNQDDEYDEYISYSSSNDDIMLTEPNSKI